MIVNEFLKPEVSPDSDYPAAADVIAWRCLDEGNVYVEIFRRVENTFGFRYRAWVAWRDAGDQVRSHDWHVIDPKINLITSTQQEAIIHAELDFQNETLVSCGEWTYILK